MANKAKEETTTHTTVDLNSKMLAPTTKISTARLPILKAPGSNSNYLNWKKVVLWVFKSAKVNHVLTPIVDEANLRHLADKDNTAKIWADLSRAHQDTSTGGRIFWICKLFNARMDGDNFNLHIDSLANSYKRLNSLVTPEKPLTPDDVHNAALLGLLSPDWIP
ncbi:hypothetical protein PTTG_26538 [Puccinia triticina 1-1 BBBD Race 1]|uniref:Uncharacterized protein n=1 Tax=Puccinia triticina (isolate 1-1 / race 1 (BBBD)) TaxID=630390 RepID=A0A180GU74_PUCT1|nr:hypothetical protein PTTG_26538 [Puccinia triticina 1-1 BBBD Race 1]